MLVAERFVERMRVGPAVSGVQDHDLPASPARLVLQGLHQLLADSTAAEAPADDEPSDLATGLVAFDEVLDVQRAESSEVRLDLRDDHPRRGIGGDPLEALSRLPRRRRVAELAEQRGDGGRVSALGGANLYGGGAGGGASSSTYVVLLRPHERPSYHAR